MRAWLFLLCLLPAAAHAEGLVGCQLHMPKQVVIPQASLSSAPLNGYAQVGVECEAGLAYQLEIQNAERGGTVWLSAPEASEQIPLRLIDGETGQPWGALAQGEALGGSGTGTLAWRSLEARIQLSKQPAAGNYSTHIEIVLVF